MSSSLSFVKEQVHSCTLWEGKTSFQSRARVAKKNLLYPYPCLGCAIGPSLPGTFPTECPVSAFIFFLFFYLFIFYLWWILSYIEMKQPRVYMCSPSQSPLPPPSPPAPSRFSQCTRSEHLSHASNLGW